MERNDESVLHTQHRETAELFEDQDQDQDQDQQALNHVLAVLVQYQYINTNGLMEVHT